MAAKPFNRFSDLSFAESFHLIKSAFYVAHPEAARLVKIHALMTDLSPLEVEMFEEREGAAKWLGVPVELLMAKV